MTMMSLSSLWKPRHTFISVVQQVNKDLRDGTIDLRPSEETRETRTKVLLSLWERICVWEGTRRMRRRVLALERELELELDSELARTGVRLLEQRRGWGRRQVGVLGRVLERELERVQELEQAQELELERTLELEPERVHMVKRMLEQTRTRRQEQERTMKRVLALERVLELEQTLERVKGRQELKQVRKKMQELEQAKAALGRVQPLVQEQEETTRKRVLDIGE